MNRFSRINVIWRKELVDTLRDRRTLIAMIVVPIVLYPAMMLGSLQGFELQVSRLKQETYNVGVPSEEAATWLRRLLDTDAARHPGTTSLPAEEIAAREARRELEHEDPNEEPAQKESVAETARKDVHDQPPAYELHVVPDAEVLRSAVKSGTLHAGVLMDALPTADGTGSAVVTVVLDQTDWRSQIAAAGLDGVFERASEFLLRDRLRRVEVTTDFIQPLVIRDTPIASPERVGGSILGQIVPLILVVMTITGAIYPAIDLTAGERERGTLETLMVAPVPTVDLIAGKFIVVTLVAMFSAALNLLSIGGTIYLGGLGNLLARGGAVVIPLSALPWVLLTLIPLAVLFSAALLAVCSFARSFKEAQNYVMPVMVAAMIPAIVGMLPGTRLEGPLLIVPVANIVLLTRDLFMSKFDPACIAWVTISTTLYAGAAVAVAAKLFGQEAVLFADSGSVKTLFQRRFFKPSDRPTASQALLLVAVVFSANFFAQQGLMKHIAELGAAEFWWRFTGIVILLFVLAPAAVTLYSRVRPAAAFALRRPPLLSLLAAVCFGASTWILARVLFVLQSTILPIDPKVAEQLGQFESLISGLSPAMAFLYMAAVPAVCEELFFRGYALSGVRGALGKVGAVLVVAAAFGLHHHSIYRVAITGVLGLAFGLLVVQFRSIWPAMIAHLMHNGLSVLSERSDALQPLLRQAGFVIDPSGMPPLAWTLVAAVVCAAGVLLCFTAKDAAADSTTRRDPQILATDARPAQ